MKWGAACRGGSAKSRQFYSNARPGQTFPLGCLSPIVVSFALLQLKTPRPTLGVLFTPYGGFARKLLEGE